MSTEVLLAGTDLDAVLEARGVPATLEGAIVARVDRLPHVQQLVIRAASVVGPDVRRGGATRRASGERPRDAAAGCRGARAGGSGRARRARSRLRSTYEFRHVLLRDVAYHGMSFSERRRASQGGRAVDGANRRRASRRCSTRCWATTFAKPVKRRPAARYLARAGEAAVKSYSNKEAATLLDLGDRARSRTRIAAKAAPARRGVLELLLGRAYLALSRYSESKHSQRNRTRAGGLSSSLVGAT